MNSWWLSLRALIKLIRLRIRLWWNSFKHSTLQRKIVYLIVGISMLFFAGFLVFLSWGVLALIQSPQISEAMRTAGVGVEFGSLVTTLPSLLLTGVFLAGIVTTFGALLQTLYLSGDTEFLLAAPIPAKSVFASKLLQAIFPGLLILSLLTFPALLGLGLAQGYNLLYFILLPVSLLLLIGSAGGVSAILVMFVVRLVSPRRAAEILGLIGGIVAILFSQIGQFTNNFDQSSEQIFNSLASLNLNPTPFNPLSWPGMGLVEIGQSHWSPGILFMGLTILASTVLIAFSLITAERLYFSGWSRVQAGTTAKKRGRSHKQETSRADSGVTRLLPAPVRALIMKDIRMYRRDLRNLSQLVTPILFAVIWTLTLNRPGRGNGFPIQGQAFIEIGTIGIALFIGFMFAIRFGMGGLSSEGKQWWIIKSSPILTSHLLLAKFLIALVPTVSISLIYVVISSVLKGGSVGALLYYMVVITLVTAAECSMLLSFGIWTARFDWDNPRQISSGFGGCLGTLFTVAFLGASTILFVGPVSLASFLGLPVGLGVIVGVTSGLALCAVVGILPLWQARSKIPYLGEEKSA